MMAELGRVRDVGDVVEHGACVRIVRIGVVFSGRQIVGRQNLQEVVNVEVDRIADLDHPHENQELLHAHRSLRLRRGRRVQLFALQVPHQAGDAVLIQRIAVFVGDAHASRSRKT